LRYESIAKGHIRWRPWLHWLSVNRAQAVDEAIAEGWHLVVL